MIYALIASAALYILAASFICLEVDNSPHKWCPLCWCIALYMRWAK